MNNSKAMQILSGIFLGEPLPENAATLPRKELLSHISNHIGHPFQEVDEDDVLSMILSNAGRLRKMVNDTLFFHYKAVTAIEKDRAQKAAWTEMVLKLKGEAEFSEIAAEVVEKVWEEIDSGSPIEEVDDIIGEKVNEFRTIYTQDVATTFILLNKGGVVDGAYTPIKIPAVKVDVIDFAVSSDAEEEYAIHLRKLAERLVKMGTHQFL